MKQTDKRKETGNKYRFFCKKTALLGLCLGNVGIDWSSSFGTEKEIIRKGVDKFWCWCYDT